MKNKHFKDLLRSLKQALVHARGHTSGSDSPEDADDMAKEYDFPALKEQALREGRSTEPECVRMLRRARAGEMFGYPVDESEARSDEPVEENEARSDDLDDKKQEKK